MSEIKTVRITTATIAILLLASVYPGFSPHSGSFAAGEPSVSVLDAHHRMAVWGNFTELSGYGATNLTVSGGGAVLAPDPVNYTGRTESAVCAEAGDQQYPSIAMDSEDNFIVVWQDRRGGTTSDICAKVFNSTTGAQVGNEITVSAAADDQVHPFVAVDLHDNFVVAWEDYRSGGYSDIYAKVFNSLTGEQVGGEIPVCTAQSSQVNPSVAVDPEDNFVVVWQDFRNANGIDDYDIYAKVFNTTTGAQVGGEISVSTAHNSQLYPSVATDRYGDFIAAWTDYRSGTSYDIYAKAFNTTTGAQVGGEMAVSTGSNSQMYPSVAVDSNGYLVAAWQDYDYGTAWDIHAKVMDLSSGTPVCGEIFVTYAANNQGNPSVAVDTKGGFIVAWQDYRSGNNYDIYAKMFNSTSGVQLGGEITVSDAGDQQQFPSAVLDREDCINVVWQDYRSGTDWDIYGCHISHSYIPQGWLVTPDFSPPDLYCWGELTIDVGLPDAGANAVLITYSIDSGTTWNPVPVNHSLAAVPTATGTMRFRADLTTNDSGTSPVLFDIELDYTINHRPFITLFPSDCQAHKNGPMPLVAGAGDGDNDSLTYSWTLDNSSGASLANGSGHNATFLASESGNYTIRLTVSDGYAAVERAVNLTVVNRPPISAIAAAREAANISEPVHFDASGSSDPDGDGLDYRFDFGDGNTSTWQGATATHAYGSPGDYFAFVEVSDGEDISCSTTVDITIWNPLPPPENLRPVAAFGAGPLAQSDHWNFTFTSTSTDADGTIMTTVWNFGDGATGIGVVIVHRYAVAGNYTVRLTVTDNDGATNSTARLIQVNVQNRLLEVRSWEPFGNPSITAGKGQPFSITASDPEGNELTYHWELNGRAIPDSVGPDYAFKQGKTGSYLLRVTVSGENATPFTKEWLVTVKGGPANPTSFPELLLGIPVIIAVAALLGSILWVRRRPPPALQSTASEESPPICLKPPQDDGHDDIHGDTAKLAGVNVRPVLNTGESRRQTPSTILTSIQVAVALLFMLLALFPLIGSNAAGASRAPVSWASSDNGLPANSNYFGVSFGDINRDGNVDVVGASDGSGLRVFTGNGAGTWTAVAKQPATSGGFSDVRIGDLDNDGNMDLVAGSPGNGAGFPQGIHIFKGNGAGGFTEVTSGSGLPTSGYWRGVAIGDVNGDGKPDIAATSGYGGSSGIHVYTGDGTGRFTDNSTGLPGNLDCDSGIVFADFNLDGKLDLAAGGSPGVAVYLGNGGLGGAMSWTAASNGLPAQRFTGVNVTDFDNDGAPDLLLASYNAGGGIGLRACRNVNKGSSWASASDGLPTSGDFLDVSSGDFDSDGNVDLVTGGVFGTKGMKAYYGNGAGKWTESSTGLPSTDEYVGTDVADFNNDGSPDILIGSYSNRGLMVFENLATPAPVLSLTGPASDVSWSGGSHHTISWNAVMGSLPYGIGISCSTDGGVSFPGIVATGIWQSAPGRDTFDWTVPNLNSIAVRLRIDLRDARDRRVSSESGQSFEIDFAAPSVASTVPANGAVEVPSNTAIRVRFTEGMNRTAGQGAVTIFGPGGLELSSPVWNGNEVTFQTSGLQPSSAYNVTVSDSAKDDSDPGNALADPYTFSFNTSASPVPTISLESPSGGDEWVAGTVNNITWSATGGTGTLTVSFELSTQGENGPWVPVAAAEPNDGQFAWTVPDTPSTDCILRETVTDSNAPPMTSDAMSGTFTIKAAPPPISIDLTAPNGGEAWAVGTVQNITWTATGRNGALDIALRFSTVGPDGPWTDIAANETNDGVYPWTIPDTPTTGGCIQVSARDDCSPPNSATDHSDATFNIVAAPEPVFIILISPEGGEAWTAGTVHDITWNAAGGSGALTIALAYSTIGATGPWLPITAGESNDGNYPWRVPPTPSTDCFVRATATDSYTPPRNASYGSRTAFRINAPFVDTQPPTVRMISPAHGAVLRGMVPLRMTASDDVGVLRVEILLVHILALL